MTDNLPTTTTTKPPANTAPKGIPIEDLIAYRAKGLSTTEIGKLTGCDHSNVARRLKEAELESLDRFQEHKDKVFEHTQRELVKSITGGDIKAMSGLQKITGAAILQDKIMAMRGQATQIIEHRSLVVDLNRVADQLRAEQGSIVDLPVDNPGYQPQCPETGEKT